VKSVTLNENIPYSPEGAYKLKFKGVDKGQTCAKLILFWQLRTDLKWQHRLSYRKE